MNVKNRKFVIMILNFLILENNTNPIYNKS